MFCGNCGKKIEENAKFCPYCGLAIPVTENVKLPKKETIRIDVTEEPLPVSKTKIFISLIVVILIVLAGIVFLRSGGFISLNSDNHALIPDSTEIEQTVPMTTTKTFFDRGKMFFDRGDFETAIADFSEVIIMDPNMAEAYRLRGSALIRAIDDGKLVSPEQAQTHDRAIADFTHAIRLEPNDSVAYWDRGATYELKGDHDKAITDFTQAIQLDPNYAAAYYARGLVYGIIKEEYSRAIADFEAALRLEPNNVEAKNWLEKVRQARGY